MMFSNIFSAHPVLDHALPNLSDYGFFEKPIKDHVPINKVLPYKIASPLFSDYSEKLRFIQVPVNETITHNEENKLFFPVGTFLIKISSEKLFFAKRTPTVKCNNIITEAIAEATPNPAVP